MSFEINKTMIDGRELVYLTIPEFSRSGLVKHCFTTRVGGVSTGIYSTLNTSLAKEDPRENVMKNLDSVCRAIDIDYTKLIRSDQVHEDVIRIVRKEDEGKGTSRPNDMKGVDALITNVPGVPLITFYADCVPIFILDPKNKAVGLVHSGWRGTVKKIGAKTLKKMKEAFGTEPEHCFAGIGPSIEKKCFEVGWDTASEFINRFGGKDIYMEKKDDGKYLVDLWRVNRDMLQEEGVPVENINISGFCTKCGSELFFSHRRDKGRTGSLSAIIELV